MNSLFASDLHLSCADLDKVALFEEVLARAAASHDVVYLLGDVFEIWLGDDDDSDPNPRVVEALRRYSERAGTLFVMSGNRDFLFGEDFAATTGATLLADWHTVDLFGVATLLTHGDLLCTRDVQYQAFRQYVRDPANQQAFLANSLDRRRDIAAQTRTGTKTSMLEKEDFIMDVEQATVEDYMLQFGAARLIHGHTHRPADHTFTDRGGQQRMRHVLGDWYGDCSMLIAEPAGVRRLTASQYVQPARNG